MGVPVVTYAGNAHVSRVGVSILSSLSHRDWIAGSAEAYIGTAVKLTSDISHLIEIRRTLRPRMLASPLMDAPRFAQNIEAAFRQMWQSWCANRLPVD
jgi:predicted O-linked N-acetylglucosamine transferase (SPINDLY family)